MELFVLFTKRFSSYFKNNPFLTNSAIPVSLLDYRWSLILYLYRAPDLLLSVSNSYLESHKESGLLRQNFRSHIPGRKILLCTSLGVFSVLLATFYFSRRLLSIFSNSISCTFSLLIHTELNSYSF